MPLYTNEHKCIISAAFSVNPNSTNHLPLTCITVSLNVVPRFQSRNCFGHQLKHTVETASQTALYVLAAPSYTHHKSPFTFCLGCCQVAFCPMVASVVLQCLRQNTVKYLSPWIFDSPLARIYKGCQWWQWHVEQKPENRFYWEVVIMPLIR